MNIFTFEDKVLEIFPGASIQYSNYNEILLYPDVEFMYIDEEKLFAFCPTASIEEGDAGQVIIYTDKTVNEAGNVVDFIAP